jgi:peptidoglycan/LPS O-acetylase OafA/YrhL
MIFLWVLNLDFIGPYVLLPSRMDCLSLGVLAAYLIRQPWFVENLGHRSWFWSGSLLILGTGIILLALYYQGWNTLVISVFGYTWYALFYFCLLFFAVFNRSRWGIWAFQNPVLRSLGFISYGVYLFHQGINDWMHGVFLGQPPRWEYRSEMVVTVGSFVIVLLVAAVAWQIVEKPFIRLGHRFHFK